MTEEVKFNRETEDYEELVDGLLAKKIEISREKCKIPPTAPAILVKETMGRIKVANDGQTLLLSIALFVLLQVFVSTAHYSGYNTPPMYGDFEAQRHWMELTVNLPLREWYVNSTDNDLGYWGLDYPPLTAYHSWLVGRISAAINPTWTQLHSSRGVETPEHKLFMRCSVIATMLALYAPALLLLQWKRARVRDEWTNAHRLIGALCYPGLIFVDNGHFQYNHIALGLFLWSILLFQTPTAGEGANEQGAGAHHRRWLVYAGCVLFTLAINFKHMELYHSLPVFVLLLSRSIPSAATESKLLTRLALTLQRVVNLGTVVVLTFAVLWAPFFWHGWAVASQTLSRLFPLDRGLFEDNVANFWCALSVLVKVKRAYSARALATASSALVLISLAPSLYLLFRRPSDRNFRSCLSISALSFFLFSFQVHEKSILMAVIPTLLMLDDLPTEVSSWFLSMSLLSLYPLCIKDGMPEILPLFITYHFFMSSGGDRTSSEGEKRTKASSKNHTPAGYTARLHWANLLAGILLCFALLVLQPPRRYPHLFELLTAVFSFGHFLLFWLYLHYLLLFKWNPEVATRLLSFRFGMSMNREKSE